MSLGALFENSKSALLVDHLTNVLVHSQICVGSDYEHNSSQKSTVIMRCIFMDMFAMKSSS